MKTYLCSYSHEGATWSFKIQAESHADAEARLNSIHFATCDGELMAEIPAWAAGGIVARFLCWWHRRKN